VSLRGLAAERAATLGANGQGEGPHTLRPVTLICTREWLEDELRRAILRAAYENDTVLFGRDACERSIMFRIGRYLAPIVEERWPGRLWVDCEYNRIADPVQARVAKRVRGLGRVPDQQRSVFPDLIVHDRTGSSSDHNILVVEAKKSPANARSVAFDRRKLKAYQRELMYQNAVYLELARNPRWQWMDRDRQLRPVAEGPAGVSGDDAVPVGGSPASVVTPP
jgi:hypothetical protein